MKKTLLTVLSLAVTQPLFATRDYPEEAVKLYQEAMNIKANHPRPLPERFFDLLDAASKLGHREAEDELDTWDPVGALTY